MVAMTIKKGEILRTAFLSEVEKMIVSLQIILYIWAEDRLIFSEVLQTGIKVPPPGIYDVLRFHLEGPEFKMRQAIKPRFTIPPSQTVSVSVLVSRKNSDTVACIINKSFFEYVDRTAYRAMAFDYLEFSPVHPFIVGARAWFSLLFNEDGNEGVIDVFGIEMDFCDTANSKEEVLWLLHMLNWK
ncbi:F-box protein At5g39250-like [Corylus avellana]|uniref:F-box protein At5g39250-like n=1 Tax=Corylus avellana TaxID=13451 RepID=UPI00286B6478|nr:F-box protein At5g39250-like [Corylus avellana]